MFYDVGLLVSMMTRSLFFVLKLSLLSIVQKISYRKRASLFADRLKNYRDFVSKYFEVRELSSIGCSALNWKFSVVSRKTDNGKGVKEARIGENAGARE